jgi:hypothetical protein
MDSGQAMEAALRMAESKMKVGGAVMMAGGGAARRTRYEGPMLNRPVVNGRAVVSTEELADFRRQFGADKTLRDLLNADRGLTRRGETPSAQDMRARGPQGPSEAPASPYSDPSRVMEGVAASQREIARPGRDAVEPVAPELALALAPRIAQLLGVSASALRARLAAAGKDWRNTPPRGADKGRWDAIVKQIDEAYPQAAPARVETPPLGTGRSAPDLEPMMAGGGLLGAASRAGARAAARGAKAAEAAAKVSELSPIERGAQDIVQRLKQADKSVSVTPATVQRMIGEKAEQFARVNPKLTEEAVIARAQRETEKQLQWERQRRPELQKQYGPLSPSQYDQPAPRRLRNLPAAVEERAAKAEQFLSKPTPPWEPPKPELQAFDRSLIKEAMEGFPGVEQTRFPRYQPQRAQTEYVEEVYEDPRNRELIKQQIKRGLPLGGETFYASLYPLKVAAMERGIPASKFDQFIYETAPASARNSIMNEMAVGQFMRDMKARGLPLDEQTVAEEMANFKQKYGTGLPLMPVHREGVRNIIESGANMRDLLKADIPTNYKIPTYGTQKAGDFGKSMVLDVHEAAGQTQGSRFHPYFTEQGGFGPTEYGLAESKMLDIAQELGIPGGMAQAGRWFGGGELTGLKSPRGDALDLLEKQTAYTLQGQGINPTPKAVRDYILNMIETGQGVLMPYFKSAPMPDVRTMKAEGGEVKGPLSAAAH